MDLLKPCPFCGGEARLIKGPPGCAFVRCETCKASTDDRLQDVAIAAWNRRSDMPEIAKQQHADLLFRRADLPPTREAALALPEIAALVEAAKERDGGGHDEDCRINRKYREPVHCNCGHDALQAALTAIAQEKQG